jgi:hypothetical protein
LNVCSMSKYLSTFFKTNPVINSDQAKHGYHQILMYKVWLLCLIFFFMFPLDIADIPVSFSGHGTTTRFGY